MSLVVTAGAKAEDKVGGNQRAIPVIQTDNKDLTQVQQNTNKVFRNISDQADQLQIEMDQTIIIGEIKIANLTQPMFQGIAGDEWLLCNGQSCVDTEYSRLTGLNVVPTFTVGGINTFIRIN